MDFIGDLIEKIAADLDGASRVVFSTTGKEKHVTRPDDELQGALIGVGNAGEPIAQVSAGGGSMPLYPIAGHADRELLIVKIPEIVPDPGQHGAIPHFLDGLRVEISQDLDTVGIHATTTLPSQRTDMDVQGK